MTDNLIHPPRATVSNAQWLTTAELAELAEPVREAAAREVRDGDAAANAVIGLIGAVVIGGWLLAWALGALA